MNTNTITETFDLLIHDSIQNSFPSLFTKEDVIKVLRDLEAKMQEANESEPPTPPPTQQIDAEKIRECAENIAQNISQRIMKYVNDYELTMSGREIELDDITIDESDLSDLIEGDMLELINN